MTNPSPELLAAIREAVIEAVREALGERAKPMEPDETRLTRAEAVLFCRSLGQPVARGTFEQYASKGGGPTIEYFGAKPLYRVRDLREWLSKRTKRAGSATERRSEAR